MKIFIELVASILVVIQLYLFSVGSMPIGFMLGIAGAISWAIYAIMNKSYFMLILNVILIGINITGLL